MEDVFPIELGDISASYVSLPEGIPFEGSWVPMMIFLFHSRWDNVRSFPGGQLSKETAHAPGPSSCFQIGWHQHVIEDDIADDAQLQPQRTSSFFIHVVKTI